MTSQLQRRVLEAVAAGTSLDVIERTIIDRTSLDEEHRAALWLYAEALRAGRGLRARVDGRDPALTGS